MTKVQSFNERINEQLASGVITKEEAVGACKSHLAALKREAAMVDEMLIFMCREIIIKHRKRLGRAPPALIASQPEPSK